MKVVYSYGKVWKVENRIYSIQNIHLPFPINPYELLYFIVTACLMFFISAVFQFDFSPVLYVAFPYLITSFISKKKLDGKNPLKFFLDYVIYQVNRHAYVERWIEQSKREHQNKKIKLHWQCSFEE